MSKIKSILLNESYISDELIDQIQEDCKYYFDRNGRPLHSYPVYRGIYPPIKTIETKKPRKDRTPIDTPKEIHKKLDELFKKEFGWKARSEGVFVTGSRSQAGMYGDPHIVLPIGKFKYVWSPSIPDLTVYLERDVHVLMRIHGKEEIIMEPEEYNKILKNTVNKYKSTDFENAILSRNEIIIKCDRYYLINENFLDIKYRDLFW